MKRFQLLFAWTLSACLVLGVAACDDEGNGGDEDAVADMTTDTAVDTSMPPDTSVPPDTTMPPDAVPDAVPDAEPDVEPDVPPVTCDRTGFTAETEQVSIGAEAVRYSGISSATQPNDLILLEWWDIGAGLPITGPGTFELGATTADQNYSTCANCALIGAQCEGDSCAQYFFATEGTIEVTEYDDATGTLVGTLNDAVLTEVTLGEGAVTTPVANGETWCIESYAFSTAPECVVDADCVGNANGESCIAGVCATIPDTCTTTDFTPADETFDYGEGVARYQAVSSTTEPQDVLLVEFWDIGNGIPLAAGPGTYPLGGSAQELNYQTCETCALIYSNCTEAGGCEKTFFAVEGAIEVTSVDAATNALVATLNGVKLIEVTISDNFVSTPVAGGDSWCIDGYAIDTLPECATDADCIGNVDGEVCNANFECVVCASSLDCTDPTAPACVLDDTTGEPTCAVIDVCTGDDAAEHGDDGPTGATALVAGTQASAMICDLGAAEADWFTFTLAEESNIELTLAWADTTVDLDIIVVDSDGLVVGSSLTSLNPEVVSEALVAAGTYYVVVVPFVAQGETGDAAAIAYTLDLTTTVPECTTDADCVGNANGETCDTSTGTCVGCLTDFDCTVTAPVCDTANNVCIVIDECTGDDAAEHADDGPVGATTLVLATPASAKICGEAGAPSAPESDWFTFDLTAATDITLTVSWTDTAADLDLFLVDSMGGTLDFADNVSTTGPEAITQTMLAAGTYYVVVDAFGAATVAVDYTLELTSP